MVLVGLVVLNVSIAVVQRSSASAGLLADVRGSWQGAFVAGGMPVATPIPISMDVTSQGIGNFSGMFTVYGTSPGTLTGNVSTGGIVTFHGHSADVDLSNGRATFTDYTGGAAIIDGTMTVASSNPFISGVRKIREIRPFADTGNCPCTPRVGDYIGTWGSGATSGPIKFTVQAPDHTTPTKFTSYLYITIDGQQHGGGLIGTGNGNGDIVAMAYTNTGYLRITATLTDQLFLRISSLNGTFTYELNDGTVMTQHFSAIKQ